MQDALPYLRWGILRIILTINYFRSTVPIRVFGCVGWQDVPERMGGKGHGAGPCGGSGSAQRNDVVCLTTVRRAEGVAKREEFAVKRPERALFRPLTDGASCHPHALLHILLMNVPLPCLLG